MRILSRYFAARYLGLFAAILFASLLTVTLVEMLLNLDDMLRAKNGVAGIAEYLFLRIPSYYLRELIPITSFAATFFTLALSSHWLEVLAVKTGGISLARVVAPILAAAAVLAVFSFWLSENWIVPATRTWSQGQVSDEPRFHYRDGSFWYHSDRTLYNISSADLKKNTLRGVRLFELNHEGRVIRIVEAEKVDLEADHVWRLHAPTIRRFVPDQFHILPRVERVEELSIEVVARQNLALIHQDLRSVSLEELADYIRTRAAAGENVERFETLFQFRLTEPLAVLIFAMLAAPLGLRVDHKGSFGIPAMWGIFVVASFFTLRSVSQTLSNEGVISAVAASWSVVGLFTLLGSWRLTTIRS